MKNHTRAFTLIELLIVIAIIGILSSVVLTNLTAARGRARIASAESTLRGVLPAALQCSGDSHDILDPIVDSAVCSDVASTDAVWPALPPGWSYDAGATLTAGSISFSASGEEGARTVTCIESGCVTS